MIPMGLAGLQYLVSGMTLGSVYAMIAPGFHPHLQRHRHRELRPGRVGDALGALFAIFFAEVHGLIMPLAVPAAAAARSLVGSSLELAAIRASRGASGDHLDHHHGGALHPAAAAMAMLAWGPDALFSGHSLGTSPTCSLGRCACCPSICG